MLIELNPKERGILLAGLELLRTNTIGFHDDWLELEQKLKGKREVVE